MVSPADSILTLLQTGADPLNVHDTLADADETAKVVLAVLPYVVFVPLTATPERNRGCGSISMEMYWFDVMYVGLTREQAEAARDRSRARVEGMRPAFTGNRGTPIARQETAGIQKEDTYTGPGGAPLVYGVDRYAVVI